MKINNLELRSFGKFQDQSVELADGLNVLYAPNETGKSTLAGFIRYMLYGFPKKERSSASNPLTTAQRFKPWQGGDVGGSMTVTVDGRRATVVREGARAVRMYDTVTMSDIPLADEPGEELYGLSLDTFESTAFFGQSTLANVSMDELEDKLKNIVTGGDENVSYEKARDALNKAKNRIGGRVGQLPALQAKMQELSMRIERARLEQDDLQQMGQACEQMAQSLAQAKEQEAQLGQAVQAEYARVEKAVALQREQLQEQIEACRKVQEQAQQHLGGLDRRAVEECNGLSQRLSALRDLLGPIALPAKPKKPILWLILGLVLLAGGVGAYFFVPMPWPLLGGLGVVALILYGILCSRAKAAHEQRMQTYERERRCHEEAAALHGRLAEVFGDLPDYTAVISERYDDLLTISEQQTRIDQLAASLAALDAERTARADEGYRSALRRREDVQAQLRRMESGLSTEKARLEERSRHVGDVEEWKEQLGDMQERRVVLEQELAAYELALQALDDAHMEMTHLYAPMLAERTAEFFSTTTGDTERRVAVNVGGKVQVEEKAVARNLLYYSVGTADAVYVSLRLALIDMLYTKEKPTLVFDDSFANFDEGRMTEMFKLLGKLAQKAQILYFTCRDPKPMLKDIPYHNIQL